MIPILLLFLGFILGITTTIGYAVYRSLLAAEEDDE